MLQHYKFCYNIESSGKNNVNDLIKLQSTSFFFIYIELIFLIFMLACFQKLFKILQNGTLVTIALFLTHPLSGPIIVMHDGQSEAETIINTLHY